VSVIQLAAAFYLLMVDFLFCLMMASCFYGPDAFLDGRAMYDTDSELARRPVRLFVHWEFGICICWGIASVGDWSLNILLMSILLFAPGISIY
jgi:hypothetical protein